jgi:DNA-binding NarL/FixJ family response regulator
MEQRRVRGTTRHAGWGMPLPAEDRPEKIERGRRLAKAIAGRGTGAVPIVPHRAYEALVADIAAVELMPEWEIDKAVRGGGITGAKRPPTPREVQFAQGYANGETGNELAHRLGVKMESVSRAFERLQFNLGARSRYQAIAMLAFNGYISAPAFPKWSLSGRGARATTIKSAGMRPVRSAGELTQTEAVTLRMISEGMSNDEIAAAREKSVETVKSQTRTLIRKLGARNRSHAVAIGFKRDILG